MWSTAASSSFAAGRSDRAPVKWLAGFDQRAEFLTILGPLARCELTKHQSAWGKAEFAGNDYDAKNGTFSQYRKCNDVAGICTIFQLVYRYLG